MKLQHIALGCLCVLLAAGVYLTIKSDMDAQLEEQKAYNKQLLDQMRSMEKRIDEKPAAPPAAPAAVEVAATPSPATTPPAVAPAETAKPAGPSGVAINSPSVAAAPPELAPGKLEEREQDILNSSLPGAERAAIESATPPAADSGRRLTKVQQLVLAQPAIARISQNKEDAGFVVIDRGKRANLMKGDAFAVRRGTAIIGRVVIGDTVEDEMAVADIKSTVTGISFEEGDEIIKFDQQ